MDRVVEMWERWAGVWLTETIFINIFYRLAGAKGSMGANCANFIREFDLVTLEDCDIDGALVTRIVVSDGVIMHQISVGAGAKVEAQSVVGPNVSIEDGARVNKGDTVPSGTTVANDGEK